MKRTTEEIKAICAEIESNVHRKLYFEDAARLTKKYWPQIPMGLGVVNYGIALRAKTAFDRLSPKQKQDILKLVEKPPH